MDYFIDDAIIRVIFEGIKNLVLPSKNNNYKSKFLQSNALLFCIVLLLVLKIGAVLISINFPQNIFFADITKSALENFINQTRQTVGLAPLAENAKLNQAAQLKAQDMVQGQYFNHTSPTGVTPWHWFLQAGYNYKYAGENLAVGFFDSEEVYQAWLDSPSHKANIVNPNYTEVGTAVVYGFGANNAIIVVQEFGSQLAAKTAVQPKTSSPAQTAPEQKTEAPITQEQEKVLSQEIIAPAIIETPKTEVQNNLASKVANSLIYEPDNILQDIVYAVSLIVIGLLLTLIFFNFKINFTREFVFRAFIIVVLLSAATLFNKELIISLIPHQVII